jgi:hypothetical protein
MEGSVGFHEIKWKVKASNTYSPSLISSAPSNNPTNNPSPQNHPGPDLTPCSRNPGPGTARTLPLRPWIVQIQCSTIISNKPILQALKQVVRVCKWGEVEGEWMVGQMDEYPTASILTLMLSYNGLGAKCKIPPPPTSSFDPARNPNDLYSFV